MTELLKFSKRPEFRSPSLVIGWTQDAGKLGAGVTDYLTRKLGGEPFCKIEPADFFSLSGVAIENDLVLFPETAFYACPKSDLVILKSTPPSFEWFKFLNLIMDIAENYCHVKELYTVGAMVALAAHTTPRQFFGTPNSPELKRSLSPYELVRETNYETPPGQRPTLNSFVSWAAKRRNIPAANLWVPVPFYLINAEDPRAHKRVLDFLNDRFDLRIDFDELDTEIRRQDDRLARMRSSYPEIDDYISKLESNIRLSDRENEKLVKQVEEFLRETGD